MPSYKAPLDEYRFIMNEVLDAGELSALPGFEDATPDLIASVLEEAAKFCETVLQPLNQRGDIEGCTYENGAVRTPGRLQRGLRSICRGGWTGLELLAAIWRPGLAAHAGLRDRGIHLLGQSVLRHLSRPYTRRIRSHRSPRQRRPEEPLSAENGRRGMVGDDVPDRAPLRHRSRAYQDARGSSRRWLATRSRARKYLSPRASRTSRGTSFISCLPSCRMRRRGPKASRCSWCRSSCRTRMASLARAMACALRLHRAQDGHQGLGHLRHEFRRCHGLAHRRAEPGHAGDVHDDERGPARRRHSGARHRRGRTAERADLRQGPAAGPFAHRHEGAR